jgi:hypothetical protein
MQKKTTARMNGQSKYFGSPNFMRLRQIPNWTLAQSDALGQIEAFGRKHDPFRTTLVISDIPRERFHRDAVPHPSLHDNHASPVPIRDCLGVPHPVGWRPSIQQ